MWFRIHKRDGESELAIREANQSLATIEERGKEVREVAETIRYYRARNHFGERVDAIVRHRIAGGTQ